MKPTQKEIIINYLRQTNDWIPSFKLRSIQTQFGWIGSQGDRRARELANEGKILHKIEGYSYYRSKEVPQKYNVLDAEGKVYKQIILSI